MSTGTSDATDLKVIIESYDFPAQELQKFIRFIATELSARSASVSVSEREAPPLSNTHLSKGNQLSSILDVKINLDTLQSFGSWLAKRLVGSEVTVRFEYSDHNMCAKYEITGNERSHNAGKQSFEDFLEAIQSVNSKDGK